LKPNLRAKVCLFISADAKEINPKTQAFALLANLKKQTAQALYHAPLDRKWASFLATSAWFPNSVKPQYHSPSWQICR